MYVLYGELGGSKVKRKFKAGDVVVLDNPDATTRSYPSFRSKKLKVGDIGIVKNIGVIRETSKDVSQRYQWLVRVVFGGLGYHTPLYSKEIRKATEDEVLIYCMGQLSR